MKRPFGLQTGSYVVVYHGTDPFHHRGDPTDPRRPSCRPDQEPGVLQHRKRALAVGLIACHLCWPGDAAATTSQHQQELR